MAWGCVRSAVRAPDSEEAVSLKAKLRDAGKKLLQLQTSLIDEDEGMSKDERQAVLEQEVSTIEEQHSAPGAEKGTGKANGCFKVTEDKHVACTVKGPGTARAQR